MIATTSAKPICLACGATIGMRATAAASRSANTSPPNAAAAALTTVIATCTVARKRSGWLRSASTAGAPRLPESSSSRSLVLRTDSSAISAPENRPFTAMSAKTIRASVHIGSTPVVRAHNMHTISPFAEADGPQSLAQLV